MIYRTVSHLPIIKGVTKYVQLTVKGCTFVVRIGQENDNIKMLSTIYKKRKLIYLI